MTMRIANPSRSALQRLQSGEAVYGLMQTMREATITELAGWSGYDFIILDCEHGIVDEAAQLESLRTICATQSFSLVRLNSVDEVAIKRYIDLGVDGLIVPDVRTQCRAREVVAAARRTWSGGSRANHYGLGRTETANARALLMINIETPEGVDNVEGILDVEGIDGVIVGPRDLSHNLGVAGDFSAATYVSALSKVEEAARARKKIVGSRAHEGFSIRRLLERGHRLIVVSADVLLIRDVFVAALSAARQDTESRAEQNSQ